ncbi:AMP-binding protein [Phaeobacter sp.]|uniref:AMP-binding protein n=1 Tax=Phaeobacter sp. TaxID=1902409 RepID=UPI0025DD8AE3|nr:AMP-binding protein [Phaeobacter sp.]
MTSAAADPQSLLRTIHAGFQGVHTDAYRTGRAQISYDQLYHASLALAARLTDLPAPPGPVLIWGHKDPRYMVAYWACLLAGRPLVPIERDTPVERLCQIVAGCAASTILVAEADPSDFIHVSVALQAHELPILQVQIDAVPTATPPALPSITAQDVAYIMFSSGTLGQPKGIQVSYGNLADFILWQKDLLANTSFKAVSGTIRHCFDVSLFELWSAWQRRCPITALNHAEFANSTAYIQRLQADGVGFWVSTPSIMRLMLRNRRFNGETLPALSTFLFCGEALSKQVVKTLFERFPGCRVINTYGPTECTVAVTSVEITRAHLDAPQDLPIGYARANTRLVATPGPTRGEIEIEGASVGRGYLNLPDKQATAFPRPKCYRTGDRGRMTAEGLWYFEGRIDREIKVQGVRIDLDDIEAHIRRQPGIEDAVVEPYVLRGEARALNAYVFGQHTAAVLQQLAEQMARDLPPYLVPRFWYAGFESDLNRNSKIDRAWLAEAAKSARHRHVHSPSSLELSS